MTTQMLNAGLKIVGSIPENGNESRWAYIKAEFAS